MAEGYLTYSQYRAVQHFASAALHVLSTQVQFQYVTHIEASHIFGTVPHFINLQEMATLVGNFFLHLELTVENDGWK